MKFTKVLGKCDPKLIISAEERLTATFTELAMGYKNRGLGSRLGGDIFLHQLISPLQHIGDARAIEFDEEMDKILQPKIVSSGSILSESEKALLTSQLKARLGSKLLRTAATNGKEFYWAPQFIIEKSAIGLRLVVGHEGIHTMYMHPSRRGSRNPALWNIAVDFKVNYVLIDDLRLRKCDRPEEIFEKELGAFITLKEYADFIKDPFNPPAKFAAHSPTESLKQMLNPGYSDGKTRAKSFYYAEPKLSEDLKKPESIYDYLFSQIPKCKTCGKVGVWKKPEEYEKLVKQVKDKYQTESHEH